MPTMLAVAKSKKEEIYRQSEKLFFRIARPGDTRLQFQDRVEKALIRSKNPQSVLLGFAGPSVAGGHYRGSSACTSTYIGSYLTFQKCLSSLLIILEDLDPVAWV